MESKHKSDYGKFEWTSGKFYGDVDKDKGLLEVPMYLFMQASENRDHIVWLLATFYARCGVHGINGFCRGWQLRTSLLIRSKKSCIFVKDLPKVNVVTGARS